MLTCGSLFAGIGGFDLGLERAGMRSLWQCEIDPYAQRVLARHWPDVLRVSDIRDVGADTVPWVDVICGGFPCQDLSNAWQGAKAGIDGARSGLWTEFARVVGELRPRYVLVENVAAIRRGALGRVLGDLAALGFDAEWECIPARAIGAPHQRDRFWLVAYPQGGRRPRQPGVFAAERALVGAGAGAGNRTVAGDLAEGIRLMGSGIAGGDGDSPTLEEAFTLRGAWATEPELDRLAHGIPDRLVRSRALGNALVPQIAEWIGTRIIEWEGCVTE